MAIKYIMFDLDGTLLPMDQEVFVKEYLKGLVTKLVPYGFDRNIIPVIFLFIYLKSQSLQCIKENFNR